MLLLASMLLLAGSSSAQVLPSELVSLRTDRNIYVAGEVLWFAATCEQAYPTELRLSSTLYLELLNDQGKAVIQQKYSLVDGHSSGGAELPDVIESGHYFLRAYTQYQRNFPPESYATCLITILNPNDLPSETNISADSALAVRFESGRPLAGIASRMVVKVPDGSIAPDSLRLQDQRGVLIASPDVFFGEFCLMEVSLEAGQSYRLSFHDTTGKVWTRQLAAANAAGLSLTQAASARGITITIFPTPALMELPQVQLRIAGPDFQCSTMLRIDLVKDGLTHLIPASALGRGEHYLLVNTEAGIPLYAGALHTANYSVQEATVELSDENVAPRSEIHISLTLPSEGGGYTVALRKVSPQRPVMANLWHNPWLYRSLMDEVPTGQQEMAEVLAHDYLLRQYASLAAPSPMLWKPESRDLGISGIVRKKQTDEPAEGVLTVVSVLGTHPQIHSQKTDKEGRFHVPLRDLEGIETVFVGATPTEGQPLKVLINRDFTKETPEIRHDPLRYSPALHQYYEQLYIATQTARLFELPATTAAYLPMRRESLPVNLGKPDVTVFVDEFIELPTMEDMIRNIVPKVTIHGEVGQRHLAVYEDVSLMTRHSPLIMLDYAAIFDVEALLKLSPKKIARFDVFQGEYYLGEQRIGGIISIFTHTDDFARYPFGEEGVFATYTTIQPGVAYEAVMAGTSAPKHQPDFRHLLYWNPNMRPGAQQLSLQAPDEAGAYEIVIESSVDKRIMRKTFVIRSGK